MALFSKGSIKLQDEYKVYVPSERLWLTEDKSEVVLEGDPKARFLFAVPGRAIPYADAERYGLTREHETERKESAPQETKERVPEETKRPRPKVPPVKNPRTRRRRT